MPRISDERRAARRARILEAAWTCFQRQGLHAASMDDIIRAALEEAALQCRAEGVVPDHAAPGEVAKLMLSVTFGFVVQSAILGDVAPEALADGLRAVMPGRPAAAA